MFNGSLRDNIIMDSHNTNYIKTTGSLLNDEFEFTRSSCSGLKMNEEGYFVEGYLAGEPYVDYHKFNRDVDLNLMFPTSYNYHRFNKAFTEKELKNLTKIKEMNIQIKVIVIKVTKFKKSGLIKTSEVINEGWLTKEPNISLELQAVKAFKIPVDDLDNIIIKEILRVDL